jgi:transposase InsO family protein
MKAGIRPGILYDALPVRGNRSCGKGWLYLAGVKDVFTCEIVGYVMDERMTQDLTAKAVWHAVRNKRPSAGLNHRSDRESQYCAHPYRKLLDQFGMKASMSRKATATTMRRWEASGIARRTN